MSESVDSPPELAPSGAMTRAETLLTGFFRPSLGNYELLANDSGASTKRAHAWVFSAAVIAGSISDLFGEGHEPWIEISGQGFSFGGAILGALTTLALFVVVIGVVHGLAKVVKGQGTYAQLAYTCAAFLAPSILLSTIANLIPLTIISLLLGIALMIYVCVLTLIAVRAVHQVGIVGALFASSPVLAVNALLIIAVIVVSVFSTA